jgi:hypothetical protein
LLLKILNASLVIVVVSFLSGCLSGSSTVASSTLTTTYKASAYATASAETGTIESVGVSCSSNSQTFTDCIKVNLGGTFTTTEQLQAGYIAVDTTSFPTGYVSQGGLTWMPVTSTLYTYAQAVTLCSGTINGLSGWCLPTQQELISLGNSGAMNGQGWSIVYDLWSSTPNPNIANNYYLVYLLNPSLTGTAVATNTQSATCVL